MDEMTIAQIWMGTHLVMIGLNGKVINGWIMLVLLLTNIVLGVAFVMVSGLWPFFVLPAYTIYYTVFSLITAWKQALNDAKEAE